MGHRLTREAVAACVDADLRIANAYALRLPPVLATPGSVWEIATVVDKVFMLSQRRVWTADCVEVRTIIPILLDVQVRCNGMQLWR